MPSDSSAPRRSARSSLRIDSRRHSKTLCFTPSFSYSRPRSSPSTCTWAPFFKVAAKSANFPNETQRCHSGRDSHAPSEFFHERCVATENAVKVDPLLIVFVSASPLFWGDQNGGARTGTASSDEAEALKTAGRGNLARSGAQDRRADQDNDVPRRSPSGLVGADDDYDRPEEPTTCAQRRWNLNWWGSARN